METLKPYAIKTLINIFNTSKIPIRRTITGQPYIDNTDIIKNVSQLYEFINNHNYSITTKRDYLIILSNVFKGLRQKGVYEYIYNRAKLYNELYMKRELCQGLDENEKKNYIIYEDLLIKLQSLINTYNKERTYKNIISLLVLALYTLQPPLRNDYNDLIYITKDNQETDKTKNYILKSNSIYYIILNKDKVIKKYGRGEIPITNKILINILDLYMDEYATTNKYLFENKNGKPYTKRQIQYIINGYFKNEQKTLNIYNLRSAYITNFYKLNQDIHSRVILGEQMRHSKNTAELIYCKFF